MRAAWYAKNGEAREVLVVGELPTPEPGAGEVRVQLVASGVNPSDVKARSARPLGSERIVPHSDGAGVIDAVGEGVSPGRVGERVWVWNGQWQRPLGTAAECIVLPETQAVRLPASTDFAAAAKARHALAAGVDATIDYKTESVAERVRQLTGGRGADAIVDMDFSTTVQLLAGGALAPHGTLVSYGSNAYGDIPIPFRAMLWNSFSLRFFLVYDLAPPDRRAAVDGLGQLVADGRLRHTVGARFGLDQIVAAHEAVEAGRLIGNVVVELR